MYWWVVSAVSFIILLSFLGVLCIDYSLRKSHAKSPLGNCAHCTNLLTKENAPDDFCFDQKMYCKECRCRGLCGC